MSSLNKCYTYFCVTGDFSPTEMANILGIEPFDSHAASDKRRDGKEYGFASFRCSKCEEYDVFTENQMRATLAPLLGKTDILRRIRVEKGLDYTLQVVVTLVPGQSTPTLAPSLDVIDFCALTRTAIDIDTYLETDG